MQSRLNQLTSLRTLRRDFSQWNGTRPPQAQTEKSSDFKGLQTIVPGMSLAMAKGEALNKGCSSLLTRRKK
jgi:hypothetical protein